MNVQQRIRYIITAVFGRFNKKASAALNIEDALTYDENVTKNRVLYRSQPFELAQLYTQLGTTYKNSFWSHAKKLKRIAPLSYGLPKLAVDKLSELVSDAYNGITIDDETLNKMWEDIEKDVDIKSLVNDITTDLIVDGQVGLFINFDNGVPYFSYKSGDDVEITYRNGKFIIGKTYERFMKNGFDMGNGTIKGDEFVLETIYEFGGISYNLYDKGGNLVPLNTLEETKDLRPIQFIKEIDKNGNEVIDTNICLFVPVVLKKSRQFKGKGQSLLDGKETAFAALDEVWTQWWASMRKSGTQTYIPADLIPKTSDGKLIVPDGYENDWISCGQRSAADNTSNHQIQVVSPSFNASEYETTFRNALQTACSGLISPSSIGINSQLISAQANTSYNSQIEKTTMNTRASIVTALSKALEDLVSNTLLATCSFEGIEINPAFNVSIDFSEFESPSFDEVSATCNSCVMQGTMSKYTALKRMNPNWSEDEIQQELQRINEDNPQGLNDTMGFEDVNEPMVESDEEDIN